jgi:hypothetical protein
MSKFASRALRLAVMAAALAAVSAQAQVIRIGAGAFTPQAGMITFSEKAFGTVNPIYAPADYGGGVSAPTVSFGGYFTGQAMGNAGSCPAGAALSGCVVGTPNAGLSLDGASPTTRIVSDGANPTSPVLSGSPTFNGPISILFDNDIAGVGLDGGYFNAIGGTSIKAFDRNGNVIGSVANEGLGIEFLGLVTSDNTNKIAGLQFSLVGAEPAGFAIDNLRFGVAGQVIVPGIPEPETYAMMLLGLGIVGLVARRRRQG